MLAAFGEGDDETKKKRSSFLLLFFFVSLLLVDGVDDITVGAVSLPDFVSIDGGKLSI